MNEEERLKDVIAQGKDANSWLNHPVYKNVIALRKASLINQFEKTRYKDSEERDEIWRKLQALNSITSDFEKMIRDAKTAESKLSKLIKQVFK